MTTAPKPPIPPGWQSQVRWRGVYVFLIGKQHWAQWGQRTKDEKGWGESPIMTFPGANATEVWAGRTAPSRYNLSAPDMIFNHFFADPEAKK